MSGILDWLRDNGYGLVAAAVVLELVGIPLPSETILLTAGATAATGHLDLLLLIVVGSGGATIGAVGGYVIGHHGGRRMMVRLVRRGWAREEWLARVERLFTSHGGKTLVVARFLPWIRIFTFWSAGAARMRLDRFMLWNVVGAMVWVVAVATVGYLFGRSVSHVEDALGTGGAVALVVAGVVALGWISLRHRRALRTGE